MLQKEQKIILDAIFNSPVKNIATWGGGTALSEVYLKHRKSEDIDIILSDLPQTAELTMLSDKIKQKLNAKSKHGFTKMNRFQYVYSLSRDNQQKLEFVYYPFPKLGRVKKDGAIKIESLKDIAVSKTLSAYQRLEVKDAFDLFIILKMNKFTLSQLIAGVEKKFGEKIDPPSLLARLMKSIDNFENLTPLLTRKYRKDELNKLFQSEFDKDLKILGY